MTEQRQMSELAEVLYVEGCCPNPKCADRQSRAVREYLVVQVDAVVERWHASGKVIPLDVCDALGDIRKALFR